MILRLKKQSIFAGLFVFSSCAVFSAFADDSSAVVEQSKKSLRSNEECLSDAIDWMRANKKFPRAKASDEIEKKSGVWVASQGFKTVYEKLPPDIRAMPFVRLAADPQGLMDELKIKTTRLTSEENEALLDARILLEPLRVLEEEMHRIRKFPSDSSKSSLEQRLANWIYSHGGKRKIYQQLSPGIREMPFVHLAMEPRAVMDKLKLASLRTDEENKALLDARMALEPLSVINEEMVKIRKFPSEISEDPLHKRLGGWIQKNGKQKGVYPNLSLEIRSMPFVQLAVDPRGLMDELKARISPLTVEESEALLDARMAIEPRVYLHEVMRKIRQFPDTKSEDPILKRLGNWIQRNGKLAGVYAGLPGDIRDMPFVRLAVDSRGLINELNAKTIPLTTEESEALLDARIAHEPYLVINEVMQKIRRFPSDYSKDPVVARLSRWIALHGGQKEIYPFLSKDVREMPFVRLVIEPKALVDEFKKTPYPLSPEESVAFLEARYRVEPLVLLNEIIKYTGDFPAHNSENPLFRRMADWILKHGGGRKNIYFKLDKDVQQIPRIRMILKDSEESVTSKEMSANQQAVVAEQKVPQVDVKSDEVQKDKDVGENKYLAIRLPKDFKAEKNGEPVWAVLVPELWAKYNNIDEMPPVEDGEQTFDLDTLSDKDPTKNSITKQTVREESSFKQTWKKLGFGERRQRAIALSLKLNEIPGLRSGVDEEIATVGLWISMNYGSQEKFYKKNKNELSKSDEIRVQLGDKELLSELKQKEEKGLLEKRESEWLEALRWKTDKIGSISRYVVKHGWFPEKKSGDFGKHMVSYINQNGGQKAIIWKLSNEAQEVLLKDLRFNIAAKQYRRIRRKCITPLEEIAAERIKVKVAR